MPRPHSPLIGLDVDGVVADLVALLFSRILERTGSSLLEEHVTRFDLRHTLGDLWPVGENILAEAGFVNALEPYPHALEGIERLRNLGRVVFVTTPYHLSPTWSHERTRWLETHAGANRRDVVLLEDKTLFAGQLLIDDAPAQLERWVETGRPAIRVVRPWNRDAPGHPAHSWDDIVDLTQSLIVEA